MTNKKKVLFVAHVDSHIQSFHLPYLKMFKQHGYEVHVASCGTTLFPNCDIKHNIPFQRNPLHIKNMKAYSKLKNILNENDFDMIHCHTPVGGVIARLANRFSKHYQTTKMIYTAHGFHFFKGAPIINWIIFYPIERLCAHWTDILITINQEDYENAEKFKLKREGRVEYVPGVGIDIDKINAIPGDKRQLCNGLHISNDSVLLLSVGELNKNKNHQVVIKALPQLPGNYHYVICGVGPLKEKYIQLAKQLGVSDRLHLLGYRSDVIRIMKSSDIFVFPSKREGLSVALLEAMASGMLCLASDIRGNTDIIQNGQTGYIFSCNHFTEKISLFFKSHIFCFDKWHENYNHTFAEKYGIEQIKKKMCQIYGMEGC